MDLLSIQIICNGRGMYSSVTQTSWSCVAKLAQNEAANSLDCSKHCKKLRSSFCFVFYKAHASFQRLDAKSKVRYTNHTIICNQKKTLLYDSPNEVGSKFSKGCGEQRGGPPPAQHAILGCDFSELSNPIKFS